MQNRKVFIMKELVVSCAMFASAAFAAVPVIDAESVTVRQDRGHTVVIEYTLNPAAEGDSEPAIVTVDILTNAVGGVAASVGAEERRRCRIQVGVQCDGGLQSERRG